MVACAAERERQVENFVQLARARREQFIERACTTNAKLLINFEWVWSIIIQQAMAVSYVLQCSLIHVAANSFGNYSSVSAWDSPEMELRGCRSER